MKIELLAPVGNLEAFKSALDNGANAIYLAGNKFGAREKATFTNEELKEMIKEAHLNEVKVYVTVNTLIYDDEIKDVLNFIDFLYNNDCDAIIVQDLGLITLVRNIYPDLEIHASTQMNTTTVKEAKILFDMGVKRVVVGRETSLETIKKIINEVGIEVEVFIHGALCVSYSGECLFSSLAARKSGNRGECLQLCRLPYSLYKEQAKIEDNKYLLSMKDLNTIDYTKELIEAGVASLKIEGRLKSGSYVGMVTRTYRKYLDNCNQKVKKEDYENLEKVFNREFTKGHLFKEQNSELTNIYRPNNKGVKIGKVIDYKNGKVYIKLDEELNQNDGIRIVSKNEIGFFANMIEVKGLLVNHASKNDVVVIKINEKIDVPSEVYKTSDYKLNEEIMNHSERRKFPLNIKVEAYLNKPLKMTFEDDLENKVSATSEYLIEQAINSPTSKEKIEQQVTKLGNTIYEVNSIEIKSDDNIIIPVSIINECRRNLTDLLNEKRKIKNTRLGKKELNLKPIKIDEEVPSLKVKVSNDNQYNIVNQYINDEDIYYTNINNVYPYPRISENKIKVNNKSVLLNELHDINNEQEMIANYYLNCTNIYTLYTLYLLGFKRVTISIEMTKKRIENLINNFEKEFNVKPNIELIIYSKVDLMITKYCPINKMLKKENMGCNECKKNNYYLEDRKGYKIPIQRDYFCNIRLLNPQAIMLFDYLEEIREMGVNSLRIEFTNEDEIECDNIMKAYYDNKIILDNKKFTYGYYKEKEE